MSGVQTVAVEEDADGMRLDRWVKKRFPGLSQGRVEKLLRAGQIRLDGGRAKSNSRLIAGQSVRMPPLTSDAANAHADRVRERASKADKLMLEAAILHKDHHVLVIDKPAGLAVQGGSKTTRHLDGMLDALTLEAAERPRLVHRLDKDTSGVLVLARTAKAATLLSETFRSKGARKVYWAIVTGVPRPAMGRINLGLHKRAGKGGEKVVADEDGKPAISDYRVIEHAGRSAAWLSLEPVTGRTHQLRVHCAALGTPILGDGKYGGKEAFIKGSGKAARQLHLHARAIRIPNPGGGILEVNAPLPDHMKKTWKLLGFEEGLEPHSFYDAIKI